jgi:hypothetical protein
MNIDSGNLSAFPNCGQNGTQIAVTVGHDLHVFTTTLVTNVNTVNFVTIVPVVAFVMMGSESLNLPLIFWLLR